MSVFWATSEIGPDGKPRLSMGSEHNRARFADDLRKNPGGRYKIERWTQESRKQRNMFEGAYVPLVAYYQENIDYKDTDDLRIVRQWLAIQFNGKFVTMGGKSVKVAKSTKGELGRGFLDRVRDWMDDEGYQTELLSPADYKKWRDEIRPFGGPMNYVDYLLECGKLQRRIEV